MWHKLLFQNVTAKMTEMFQRNKTVAMALSRKLFCLCPSKYTLVFLFLIAKAT